MTPDKPARAKRRLSPAPTAAAAPTATPAAAPSATSPAPASLAAPSSTPPSPAPRSGARDARSAARREDILAAALDEFSTRGFDAARLDDVAKRAGIAKGTIYLYFRDKETLFQELVRATLTPIVGNIESFALAGLPIRDFGARLVDVFVSEIYETSRKEVIRLMISEGRRFPNLAEFYHREVLSRIFDALGTILKAAAARGEVSPKLAEFPQILAGPALVAIIWNGLFGQFAPLDVRKMLTAHIDLLFGVRSSSP